MTKVIRLASPRAGVPVPPGTLQTIPPTPSDPVQRQAAIENALTMALFFIRQPGNTPANVWAATARTNRALTLLKQASNGNAPVNAVNAMGRV